MPEAGGQSRRPGERQSSPYRFNVVIVGAGHGRLVFALPPSELAVHPADGDEPHQLYLLTNNLEAEVARLRGFRHPADYGLKPITEAANGWDTRPARRRSLVDSDDHRSDTGVEEVGGMWRHRWLGARVRSTIRGRWSDP